jgi:kumamolisin
MRRTTFDFSRSLTAISLALSAAALAAAQTAAPFPDRDTPKPVDRGALVLHTPSTPISVTVALSLPALADAEKLVESMNTPGDPQYHHFLTSAEFVARFAPAEADVAKVVAAFARYRLSAVRTTPTTVKVTGLPAAMERAFSVNLHSFEVAAHGKIPSYTFHAPLSHPVIPAEITTPIAAVLGLDSRPSLHPHYSVGAPALGHPKTTVPAITAPDTPGFWTVTDFADYYDVQPLYSRGVSGKGHTIGIMTFASFTPSDAYQYWSALGLTVPANRIQIVNVDGGPGAPSDAAGSLETTLDVEQSGGIAPGAQIIVYQGPNDSQGSVDVFATAIDKNIADTLSVSWGEWEWFDNLQNSPVTDPITRQTDSVLQATHELLVRAALQGQSVFAAQGDGGAYDVNHDLHCDGPYSATVSTSCSLTLSVDYPGSDPLITSAGGTTLPGLQEYCLNAACTPPYYDVNIQHESVWGWDYLDGLCSTLGFTPITCGIFPSGGGGGVSVSFLQPLYQIGLQGVQVSQPGQFFQAGPAAVAAIDVPGTQYTLPAFYPGRNVPDISFNADPNTGYIVEYTSSETGFGAYSFVGGTSFVAPQLNGVTSLLVQQSKTRLGLLHVALYGFALFGQAYRGSNPPLHAISYGDNWFYKGSNGYNPGAGLGTLDVANFANFLRNPF